MSKITMLKEEYDEFLKLEMKKHKELEGKFREEGNIDESNFQKIRYNVVDIFQKMINASYAPALKANSITVLAKNYRGYYDRIPTNWRINLQKAREFNSVKDIVVEEIKLEKLEEIFNEFDKLVDKYSN